MSDYLVGLMTLPALAVGVAGLVGAGWGLVTALNAVLFRLPRRDNPGSRVRVAAAMVRTRRCYLLRVGRYAALGVFLGRGDHLGRPAEVHHVLAAALDHLTAQHAAPHLRGTAADYPNTERIP